MPGEEISSVPQIGAVGTEEASSSFREFLSEKAREFGVEGHHRRRREWLDEVHSLLNAIENWLHVLDPDDILDVQRYEVSRTEHGLGTYDAPALQITLGPGKVNIVPAGRGITSTASWRDPVGVGGFAGRVDITDGYRKYNLFRKAVDDGEPWLIRDESDRLTPLTRDSFARVLRELLS